MMIWSYDSAKQMVFKFDPLSNSHCSTPAVTWLIFGCLVTCMHLWLQGHFNFSPTLVSFTSLGLLHSKAPATLFFVSLSFIFTCFCWPSITSLALHKEVLDTRGLLPIFEYSNFLSSAQKEDLCGQQCEQEDGKVQLGQWNTGREGLESWRWLWLCIVRLGFSGFAVVSWGDCGFVVLTGSHSCGFLRWLRFCCCGADLDAEMAQLCTAP